jgi:hypothetical protein
MTEGSEERSIRLAVVDTMQRAIARVQEKLRERDVLDRDIGLELQGVYDALSHVQGGDPGHGAAEPDHAG